jgi:signal peptidase II
LESNLPPTVFTPRLHWLVALVLVVACVGCDQATKRLATSNLRGGPPRSYFSGLVRLEYALNSGGFLSLGSRLPAPVRPWIFVGLNGLLMAALATDLLAGRDVSAAQGVAMLLVLAGGLGNLIDRLFNHGQVIDFLVVGVGPVRTGVFNVADMAVTFGGLAALLLVRRRRASATAGPTQPTPAAG